MHILHLHSSGYIIFKVKEFEEIGHLVLSVRKSYNDINKFKSLITFESFYPFSDVNEAFTELQVINEENLIPNAMKKCLAKFDMKKIISLGMEFSNLSYDFKKTFGVILLNHTAIKELIRCTKCHISSILKNHITIDKDTIFLKSLTNKVVEAHSATAFSGVNIANHFHLIKEIERTITYKTSKLRQLVKPFYPELISTDIIDDTNFPIFLSIYLNAELDDKWSQLKNMLGDVKFNLVKRLMKNTIGSEISLLDLNLLKDCSNELLDLINQFNNCKRISYNATKIVAPNLTALLEMSEKNSCVNDLVATEIIANAGSLTKLAKKCSTSINTQNKKNDSLLKRIKKNSDKRSIEDRIRSTQIKSLADKCALVARVDYFGGQNSNITLTDDFGKKCYNDHINRMNTWANKRAISINSESADKINERIKKYKLRRKEKKKSWRKRKNDVRKDDLYQNVINIDMED